MSGNMVPLIGLLAMLLSVAQVCVSESTVVPDSRLEKLYGKPSLYAKFVGQRVIQFAGKAGDGSSDVEWSNGRLLNSTLASLVPGDVFVIPPGTYHIMGGILSEGLRDVTIVVDGSLVFSKDMKAWPRSTPGSKGKVLECMSFSNLTNVRFTTSGNVTTLDGQGSAWWGIPGIGYLEIGENRPRMLHLHAAQGVLVENLMFKSPPYWTFWSEDSNGLEVRNTHVDARRDKKDSHDLIDLTAFNTDGLDVTGRDVWIHDCTVWNQDDCVAVKDNSQNMLIERVEASGLGITIGSIGSSTVRNITFRDINMHHTDKGIYMKFRGDGIIEDILYENITMEEVEQYAIWIGPAQQSDSSSLCAAHPCSLCWPLLPGSKCNAPANGAYRNVTLRNVHVKGAKRSPGVILGGASTPMENVIFDGVVVEGAGHVPFGENYHCEGVKSGVATGGTSPVPSCFEQA